MAEYESVGVIGGGAWGTALAQTVRLAGRRVTLWAREPETVADIAERKVNTQYLPGVPLDAELLATSDLARIAAADIILMVAPAQHVRAVATELRPLLRPGQIVVNCAKGIERSTGKLMGDVLTETLPDATLAALSGPSFAADVARGLPTALTIACNREDMGRQLAEALGYRHFRLYWSRDRLGVEIGGAVKNVLAIAAGIVAGKELGASAHAALVARGFAEMMRFGAALGAEPQTFMGLSGLGDLILTCGSPQSRNMSLGRALGQGKNLADILGSRRAVTEGVWTAAAVVRIAEAKGIEAPIAEAVHAIVEGEQTVDDTIAGLLARPFKAEG
ncbi:MAG: NAD(P)-dependent glycerol-3-phosphate dehydrogenase [Hyphomicrobiaceae bacterium]|nr:NAD(P)-dependent glycerol-3-phosphate dehydrogenase [Hyphomicrobiaceae bacterium]